MQAEKFRTTQGPLKERYRTDAKAALLTLKAKGTADDLTVTCKVETGRGLRGRRHPSEMRRDRTGSLFGRSVA